MARAATRQRSARRGKEEVEYDVKRDSTWNITLSVAEADVGDSEQY